MRFSLIVSTLGRTTELDRLLQSLVDQSFKDFEVYIIDQNSDDRLDNIISPYHQSLNLKHIKTQTKGLSRGRNEGLKHASGDIITFPDDDCWYPHNTLEKVNHYFLNNPEIDGVSGTPVDTSENQTSGSWDTIPGQVNKSNVWRRIIEFSIFLKKAVTQQVGLYDESLGVGSGTRWGSGEGTDYFLRALAAGFQIFYNPDICIYHNEPISNWSKKDMQRAYSYSLGFGYVIGKHNYSFNDILFYIVIRPLAAIILSLFQGNFKKTSFKLRVIIGRIEGFLIYFLSR